MVKANGNGSPNGAAPGGRRMTGLRARAFRNLVLGALTVAALFLTLSARVLPERVTLVLSQPAPRTIVAPRSVFYNDTVRTDELRQTAREAVQDQYQPNANAVAVAQGVIRDVFVALRQAQQRVRTSPEDALDWIRGHLDVPLSDRAILRMVEGQSGALYRLEGAALRITQDLMRGKIRDNTDDLGAARRHAVERAHASSFSEAFHDALGEIVAAALQPNLVYDKDATDRAREAAAATVKPERASIHAGEVVVYEGQTVGQRQLDIAQALGLLQPGIDYVQAIALVLFLMLTVAGFGLFIRQFAHRYYRQDKYLAVVAALTVVCAVVYRIVQSAPYFEAAALGTAAAAVIAVCLLTESMIAIAFAGLLSILVGLTAVGSDARLVVATLLASTGIVASMGRGWQRTSMIARTAIVAAVVDAVMLFLGDQVYGLVVSWHIIAEAAAAGFIGAIAGTGLVLVIQRPLLITTDLWLLELANPHEPELRRLLTEAPGTYQSSLMVATLAEAAAEAIGANALIAGVSAMYHDIGKLRRPGFFVENQFGSENPHDKLTPQLSAMILAAHVREGIDMARHIRLPGEIVDAIRQHQGTSLMAYFYDRAQQMAKPGEEVPESLFRYPGPKPQTRETAILMLADTVEAAARTLESYTEDAIREMVERAIKTKTDDGQLDEAPLTMADLTKVREQLIQTLIGAFHRRIPYPDQIERELAERLQHRREPLEHRLGSSRRESRTHVR
jgi:hypothetical protein